MWYLLLLFVAAAASGVRLMHTTSGWFFLGDWLISYQGGFVRRGLWGSLLTWVATVTHAPLIWTAYINALALLAVMYGLLSALLKRHAGALDWPTLLLFLSPATLLFEQTNAIWIGKDVLLYISLAGLLLWLEDSERPISSVLATAGLSVLCVVAILMHESFAVYSPYLVVALWPALRTGRLKPAALILPCCCSAVAIAAVMTHQGNATVVQRICAAYANQPVDVCNGWIRYLGYSKAAALADVQAMIRESHYWRVYPVWAVLALAPAVVYLLRRRDAVAVEIGAGLLVSGLFSLVLFRYGTDWGRWISFHAMCLLILQIGKSRGTLPAARFRSWWQYAGVFVWMVCWSLPALRATPLFGFVSMAARLFHRHAL